ncbi:hypothetical protein D3C80_2102660 [compost metagenome]
MLFQQKGINWNNYETWKKRGACVIRVPKETPEGKTQRYEYKLDLEIPIFTQNRDYIQQFI